jgi:hypothetical protein
MSRFSGFSPFSISCKKVALFSYIFTTLYGNTPAATSATVSNAEYRPKHASERMRYAEIRRRENRFRLPCRMPGP